MKRDMDLVRNLLLKIEELDVGDNRFLRIEEDELDNRLIAEHLFLMDEAGLIDGRDVTTLSDRSFAAKRLTWVGHDFLDSVRDPEIWQKTKDGAKAAGGFTVELLGDLAKGLIKTQIKKATGVEI